VLVDQATIVESRPRGARLRLRAVGRSMLPLFFSGEELVIERCVEGDLVSGDVAVLRGPRRELIAHVVSSIRPLTTSSYLGVPDRQPLVVLGKVIAVRRLGIDIRLAPDLVLRGHRVVSLPGVRRVAKTLVAGCLAASAPLRRVAVSRVEVKPVHENELQRAIEFAAGALGGSIVGDLQGAHGQVVAAVRRGRWCAVAWRSASGVTLAVPAWARGVGLEERLTRALS
jgi:hypothetical protein